MAYMHESLSSFMEFRNETYNVDPADVFREEVYGACSIDDLVKVSRSSICFDVEYSTYCKSSQTPFLCEPIPVGAPELQRERLG